MDDARTMGRCADRCSNTCGSASLFKGWRSVHRSSRRPGRVAKPFSKVGCPMTQPIVVLDFDGVVCDSTEECIVTAWNAWQAHSGKNERVRTSVEVPEPFRDAIRKHRSYVRTAGEYLLLIE